MSRALVQAAESGQVERLQQLLDRGLDVDSPQPGGWTALMAAAAYGHTDAFELLLARGADVHKTDDSGNTALHHAICGGKDAIVRALLQRGADVNARTQHGTTPLHMAVQEQRLRIIRRLIDAGADVNAQTSDEADVTPLKQGFKNPKIRSLLEAAGARLDPALEATVAKAVARAAAARARGETPEFRPKTTAALVEGAAFGQLDLVQALLEAGVPVDGVHRQRRMTALEAAAAAGESVIFQHLLEAGASIATTDPTGWPIMVLAANGGSAAIVQLLITRGVDANQTGSDGITPLMAAAMQGHVDVTRALLDAGADPHRCGGTMFGQRPRTALEIAQDNRRKEILPLLAAASGLPDEAIEDPAYATCRRFVNDAQTSGFQQLLQQLAVVCGRPPLPWKKRRGVFLCYPPEAMSERMIALQAEARTAGFQLVVDDSGSRQRLLVFPTADKFAVLVARGTNGVNKGLTTRAIVAWLRQFDRDNPFDLVGCGFDFLEGQLCAPVVNGDVWAERMLGFCPDCESTTAILRELSQGRFSLWWD